MALASKTTGLALVLASKITGLGLGNVDVKPDPGVCMACRCGSEAAGTVCRSRLSAADGAVDVVSATDSSSRSAVPAVSRRRHPRRGSRQRRRRTKRHSRKVPRLNAASQDDDDDDDKAPPDHGLYTPRCIQARTKRPIYKIYKKIYIKYIYIYI